MFIDEGNSKWLLFQTICLMSVVIMEGTDAAVLGEKRQKLILTDFKVEIAS